MNESFSLLFCIAFLGGGVGGEFASILFYFLINLLRLFALLVFKQNALVSRGRMEKMFFSFCGIMTSITSSVEHELAHNVRF